MAAGIMTVFMINRSLPDLMMGVETSIPPFAMDAAAPKGAPRRPQLPDFLETIPAPPCPARSPEAGSAHINDKHFTDFHGSLVNRMGSYTFLQSTKKHSLPKSREIAPPEDYIQEYTGVSKSV